MAKQAQKQKPKALQPDGFYRVYLKDDCIFNEYPLPCGSYHDDVLGKDRAATITVTKWASVRMRECQADDCNNRWEHEQPMRPSVLLEKGRDALKWKTQFQDSFKCKKCGSKSKYIRTRDGSQPSRKVRPIYHLTGEEIDRIARLLGNDDYSPKMVKVKDRFTGENLEFRDGWKNNPRYRQYDDKDKGMTRVDMKDWVVIEAIDGAPQPELSRAALDELVTIASQKDALHKRLSELYEEAMTTPDGDEGRKPLEAEIEQVKDAIAEAEARWTDAEVKAR